MALAPDGPLYYSGMAILQGRAGIARAGLSRANVTFRDSEIDPDETSPVGSILWKRPLPLDGNPTERVLVGGWTTTRIG